MGCACTSAHRRPPVHDLAIAPALPLPLSLTLLHALPKQLVPSAWPPCEHSTGVLIAGRASRPCRRHTSVEGDLCRLCPAAAGAVRPGLRRRHHLPAQLPSRSERLRRVCTARLPPRQRLRPPQQGAQLRPEPCRLRPAQDAAAPAPDPADATVSSWGGDGQRTVVFTTPVDAPAFIKRLVGKDVMRVEEEQLREALPGGGWRLTSRPAPDMPGGARFVTEAVFTFADAAGGGCQVRGGSCSSAFRAARIGFSIWAPRGERGEVSRAMPTGWGVQGMRMCGRRPRFMLQVAAGKLRCPPPPTPTPSPPLRWTLP